MGPLGYFFFYFCFTRRKARLQNSHVPIPGWRESLCWGSTGATVLALWPGPADLGLLLQQLPGYSSSGPCPGARGRGCPHPWSHGWQSGPQPAFSESRGIAALLWQTIGLQVPSCLTLSPRFPFLSFLLLLSFSKYLLSTFYGVDTGHKV